MRDPKRIQRISEKLILVWAAHPDMRLGQLLENLKGHNVNIDTFQVEDDHMEMQIDKYLEGGWSAVSGQDKLLQYMKALDEYEVVLNDARSRLDYLADYVTPAQKKLLNATIKQIQNTIKKVGDDLV